ncbi:glutamine--fructose-6-phosphate transaminase (isomerizing) [Marinomonas transparens]|uniref:Glutamine--fructose-6-phosphate aminotransferase [isomerizing] n=1 Tax=Marinomonas transparens TaxID=2795388 RepID=A0A934JPH0_9GAMM|nr:glutamine--fructose-6-phosphate transaminase (isomerizing) [Marinomonas transparens]MBJ7538243.1 glutamine--fructose-6-phosphate transaminase (isomerizing) [Marinomonas transparens]
MCGIFGVVNDKQASQTLLRGLKALEYRGYDSAGIATIQNGDLGCRRAPGKLLNLEAIVQQLPLEGLTGIAHTRWATHGKPNEANAHPHLSLNVAVVHNGIIENADFLRTQLSAAGVQFVGETDTEVLPHLIANYLQADLCPALAIQQALKEVKGTFALGILIKGMEDQIIATRRGSPLVVGFNAESAFIASDMIATSGMADEILYLEEDDIAIVKADSVHIIDAQGTPVFRDKVSVDHNQFIATKSGYDHYMFKEILEQPEALTRTWEGLASTSLNQVEEMDFAKLDRLQIIACGTSYYAGLVAKYWFERMANLIVEVDLASEFRYREPPMPSNGGCLFISQSGETADTLAALRFAKSKHQYCLSVVNAPQSSIARESDFVYRTLCGPEIGVASTKAFTSQLAVLFDLVKQAAKQRNAGQHIIQELGDTPEMDVINAVQQALNKANKIESIVRFFDDATSAIFLGRGQCYPIALEGALKLKEISYIHAEGYAAGELKHGPIALIDENMPVVVIAPYDRLFEKTVSNLQEVRARGAKVILISDKLGCEICKEYADCFIEMPTLHETLAPFVYSIAVQLLSYFTAVQRGTDVDQPRNLAKSVTVE